jgi:hypothetical protein
MININENDVVEIEVKSDDYSYIEREFDMKPSLSGDDNDYLNQIFDPHLFHDASYTQSYLTQIESGTLQPSNNLWDLAPLNSPSNDWLNGDAPSFQEVLSELTQTNDFDALSRM